VIYVAKVGDLTKIGYTGGKLGERLRACGGTLLATIEGGRDREARLHSALAAYRVGRRGTKGFAPEMFRIPDLMLGYLLSEIERTLGASVRHKNMLSA
jgi:hypothetical protein